MLQSFRQKEMPTWAQENDTEMDGLKRYLRQNQQNLVIDYLGRVMEGGMSRINFGFWVSQIGG